MTATTVRAALATVEAADAAADLTELPGLLLPALVDLIGADCAIWTELAPSAGSLPGRVIYYPEPWLDEQALEIHAQDFSLTRHTRPGGDGRPIRLSDLESRRSFRSSGMYADVAQQSGVELALAMALQPRNLHVCVSLARTGSVAPDFTPATVDLLTLLRPLLTRRVARFAAIRADQIAASGWGESPALADLTPRQQQVLRLAALGLTDAAIGHHLGCSPKTVTKHLEHIYRRLGVSCRTAAVAAVCSVITRLQRRCHASLRAFLYATESHGGRWTAYRYRRNVGPRTGGFRRHDIRTAPHSTAC